MFIHHILQHLLRQSWEEDAVVFGRAYERLIYFGHSLEILLHTVLEEETENRNQRGMYHTQLYRDKQTDQCQTDPILPLVIKFLDQFPHALDVIVSCARKTEVALWEHLFSVVGEPKDLFEVNDVKKSNAMLVLIQK